MKNDLEHRIADAFASELTSVSLTALLDEVAAAADEARETSRTAHATALNPATRPEAVSEARKAKEDAEFQLLRMEAATDQLKAKRDEAASRELRSSQRDDYEAAKAERDQLVKDLAKQYPGLATQLVDLIERIQASDKKLAAVNKTGIGEYLRTAEAIARNAPDNWEVNFDSSLPRLEAIRIPQFKRNGSSGYLWPKQSTF